MHISRHENRILVQTPAKVNLFLEVLARRSDGFHEISTVMCPISLCDTLTLELTEAPDLTLSLEVPERSESKFQTSVSWRQSISLTETDGDFDGDEAWDIPTDSRNLVLRGLAQIRQSTGFTGGARVHLVKRIPAAAGLGGGSSNAAAAIVAFLAANHSWDRQLATQAASSLGSDIPFFLGNERNCGLMHADGRGERCTPIAAKPNLRFVVCHPPEGCCTAAIYAALATDYLCNHHTPKTHGFLLDACVAEDEHKIGAGLFNALQSSAVKQNPWIETQLDILNECGGPFRMMSGSGSSCFAMLVDGQDATEVEEQVRKKAHNKGIPRIYSATSFYSPSIEQQLHEWAIK